MRTHRTRRQALSEAAGNEAKTIHRCSSGTPQPRAFSATGAPRSKRTWFLVDEASMLNLQLAERLFAAIPAHVPLVLVGDVDQLPPVGPGQVLARLIASGIAP